MTLQELSIVGAYLITHSVFHDERGLFREWYKSEEIMSINKDFLIQQANFSRSEKFVIRGIHYSLAPDGQVKVVTCTSGVIVDVLIDIRLNSPTYLQVEYIELSEESGRVIYIPSGVGHGFIVQSDSASVAYLTSSKFAPEYEKAVYLNDPELGIIWPIPVGENIIISKADTEAPTLAQAKEFGLLPKYKSN
jgi:dTDP-4-dehydrorhamnose 3,5-epimerase